MDVSNLLSTRSELGCFYVTGISSEVRSCGYVQLRNPRSGRGRGLNVSMMFVASTCTSSLLCLPGW